jgi:hypothetical protein
MAILGAPADWVRQPSKGSDRSGDNKPAQQTGLGERSSTTVPRSATVYGAGPEYLSKEGHAHRRVEVGNRPPVHPNNPQVSSKDDKRHGRDGSKIDSPYSSHGNQPAGLDRHRQEGATHWPVTHYGEAASPHKKLAGYLNGEFHEADHPNAQAKRAGNSKFTHAPLKPTGQEHSTYGGARGEPQTRPESRPDHGGVLAAHHGKLNHVRDRNRGK